MKYDSLPALQKRAGFTLIELSIVIVIIGLLSGAVLVGQELIRAAEVRAEITQIEKYNQAVNTYKAKYGQLPGDMDSSTASKFGFSTRNGTMGHGDGNGIIQGTYLVTSDIDHVGGFYFAGEPLMFWVDLSDAHLVEGSFSKGNDAQFSTLLASLPITTTNLNSYLPRGRSGGEQYVYVYSGQFMSNIGHWGLDSNNINYFGLSDVTGLELTFLSASSNSSLPVRSAYSIDVKIDDGLPQSGIVRAQYLNYGNLIQWAGGAPFDSTNINGYTSATAGSTVSCFDNSSSPTGSPGINGNAQHYSLEKNNGTGMNCALSFQFQ